MDFLLCLLNLALKVHLRQKAPNGSRCAQGSWGHILLLRPSWPQISSVFGLLSQTRHHHHLLFLLVFSKCRFFFFLIHLNFRADCVRTFFYLTEQKEDPGKNNLHRVQVSDLGSSLSLASLLSSPRAPITPGKLRCHRLEMKRIPVDLEK